MKQLGHYGASLILYAPVVWVLLARDRGSLAIVGGAIAIALAMIPDCDCYVPFVSHRGVTHTVAFAVLVGGIVGCAGWVVSSRGGPATATTFGPFAFGVATLTVVSHLVADTLTPMGIRPFWPLSDRHVTFDLVPANHWVANRVLFALGGGALVLVVLSTR